MINRFLQCDGAMNNCRAAKLWPCVLSLCDPAIATMNLCHKLRCIILRGFRNQQTGTGLKDFCEVFSGAGRLSMELLRAGFHGSAFDICYGEDQNALDSAAFSMFMDAFLKKYGMLWLGTPRSSFTVLCRYHEQMINRFLQCDAAMNNCRAAKLWPCVLSLCYPAIATMNLCHKLRCIILRGFRNQQTGTGLKDFCEVFSGAGRLSMELLRAGFHGSAFDICHGEDQNALDSAAFSMFMDAFLKKYGMLWLGTPCSSFTVLCRYQSDRNEANSFIGHSLYYFRF